MNAAEAIARLREPTFLASGLINALGHVIDTLAVTAFGRAYRTVRAHTMASHARLRALNAAVESVVQHRVPGDVVECGTARGGSAALMGIALQRSGEARRMWVFDTFSGMPAANANGPDFEHARHYIGTCRGELDDVRSLFARLGLLERTHFVEGPFQDTLPLTTTRPISVLHLDGDWYESAMVCPQHLYDHVSQGGVIQIDDYGYRARARKAVDDVFCQHNIATQLRYIDHSGRQFHKPE